MPIIIAENAGFCFGVKCATDAVERELSRGDTKIFTLGKLIHNDGYNASLLQRGVLEISPGDIDALFERAKAGERVTVVIRAHGELKDVAEKLFFYSKACKSFSVLDCTCPYVMKVRNIAAENSGENKLFILIGAENHPEVRGIMSSVSGDGLVFPTSDALEEWLCSDEAAKYSNYRISIAAQTTQKLSEWKKSLKKIKKVYTNAFIFDTICKVTEKRQTEAERIAQKSDMVLVIGSPDSSNTQKLYEICKGECADTYLIENADDLSGIKSAAAEKKPPIISITAGASTPFSVIQEVQKTMDEQIKENFEQMLEDSIKTLNSGDIVVGVITSISQNEIHVDLGAKTTGVIAHDKLTDDPQAKLDELFKVGDEVKAKVIKVSDIDGIATLDKTRVDSNKNWEAIVEAEKSGEILEGRVTEVVKGGIVMSVNSVRVFVPASLTGIPRGADADAMNALVGTTQRIKIIECKDERKRAFGSIRAVQLAERKAASDEFWNQLEIGQTYEGPIKSLTSYGAFVDLGHGVDGMVHTSELSWRRVRHPSEVVSVGEVLKVFVKSFDREKGRISLGYKTEDSDPWNIFKEKYSVDDTAEVKIVSLLPFGAFAEVVPGADGLIHISQITNHKIASPAEVLHVGDVVSAKITAIDDENRKISLSMRALIEPEEPAAEESAAEETEEASDEPVMFSTDNPDAYKDYGTDDETADKE